MIDLLRQSTLIPFALAFWSGFLTCSGHDIWAGAAGILSFLWFTRQRTHIQQELDNFYASLKQLMKEGD